MMQNFTVIFSHGRESGPWGTKIRALAKVAEKKGCQVVSRDDTDTRDPELRVSRLIAEAEAIEGPVLLVGSSMGGYVAAVASKAISPVGLFLMAPALGMPGYVEQEPVPVAENLTIVHGWNDDVVPFEPVMTFARQYDAVCHFISAGHTLVEQLNLLTNLFEDFLECCLQNPGNRSDRLLATF